MIAISEFVISERGRESWEISEVRQAIVQYMYTSRSPYARVARTLHAVYVCKPVTNRKHWM